MNLITKIQLWPCLLFMILLAACNGSADSTSEYVIVVGAGRGKSLFAHRVIYALDEYGVLLNLDIPKEQELGNDPEWSPDGQWIAYSKINSSEGTTSDRDIYFMHADSHDNIIRITNGLGPVNAPTWSPDGTQIAFYAPDTNNHHGIYLLNITCALKGKDCASNPTFLTLGIEPDWSPDGKKIVYLNTSRYEVHVVDIQNLSQTVIVSHELGRCNSPQWSPDGTKIALVCDQTIYTINPTSGHPINLVSGALYLRWKPDGGKIAFIGTEMLDPGLGQSLDLEGTISATAVFVMDANGTNITRISKSNEENIGWLTWILMNSTKEGH